MKMNKSRLSAAIKLAQFAWVGVFAVQGTHANPGAITSKTGNVTANLGDTDSTVNISGDFAEISWDEFNIANGETVNFDFVDGDGISLGNNSASLVVNHIETGTSRIDGNLDSNGHVLLINPRGVIFSQGARVNVAALTVSALENSIVNNNGGGNFDLLVDGLEPAEGADVSNLGMIENGGVINASSGGITLVGRSIRNLDTGGLGNITATQGTISMVSADKATLSIGTSGLIGVEVSEVLETELNLDEAILNSGDLQGARVIMQAEVADGLFASSAVNNSGSITAKGIDNSGGTIQLIGNIVEDGAVAAPTPVAVVNSGDLIASGDSGGVVSILGNNVIHSDAGTITANGEAGGSGGTVTITADSDLDLAGTVEAFGNGAGQQGGSVVTVAGETLTVASAVDTLGSSGAGGGSWQLGSSSITIADSGDNSIDSTVLQAGLATNSLVTVSSTGESAGDGIRISEKFQWDEDSTLKLDSSTTVEISGIAAGGGPGIQGIDGQSLEVVAVGGFTNTHTINVENFSLTVGGDGISSSSTLGNIDVANEAQITGGSGEDTVDVSGLGATLEFEVAEVVDGSGTVTVTTADAAASLSNIDTVAADSNSDTLFGSTLDDTFRLVDDGANTNVDYLGVTFKGLSDINGTDIDGVDGGSGDILVGKDGVAWNLENDHADQLNGIAISSIEVLEASGAGLTGTTGADIFALNGSGEVEIAGFRFANLSGVDGNGGTDTLLGTDQVDNFTLQSDGAVVANGLGFTGLQSVIGNPASSAGQDVLDASGYAEGIDLLGVDYQVSAAGIQFGNIVTVTSGALKASATGSDIEVLGAGSVKASEITFNGLNTVTGGAGTDRVSGADTWAIKSDGSTYAEATEGGSVQFRSFDVFSTTSGTLNDEVGGDTIILNSDSSIDVHGMSFTGLASMAAGGNGYLDASAFASGVTLNAANAVDASGLVVSGLSRVTVPLLYGTTADETFRVSDTSGTTTIDVDGYGISFDGVSLVQAGEGTGDGDVVVAAQSIHHDISSDIFATLLGIDFYQLETLDLAGGTLSGTTGNDDFTLVNSNTVSHSANSAFNFRNVSGVTGGSGVTTLDATALATGLYLTSASGTSVTTDTSDGIAFNGLAAVKASSLDTDGQGVTLTIDGAGAVSTGTVSFTQVSSIQGDSTDVLNAMAGGSEFAVLGINRVESSGITFNGLGRIQGGTGADKVTGADQLTVASDGSNTVVTASESGGLVFRDIDTFSTNNGALTDNQGGETITLNSDSSIGVHGISFTGLASMAADGNGYLDASGFASGVTLNAANAVDASGLVVSGLSRVTVPLLYGTTAAETFRVSDTGGTTTIDVDGYGISFDGVSQVQAGEGSGDGDVLVAAQSIHHDISSDIFATLLGIDFYQLETLDLAGGTLSGTAGNDDFTLVNSNTVSHSANSAFNFRNVSGVTGGSGVTTLDATALATGLYLTSASGSSVATDTSDGITFDGLASVKASSLDTNGQGVTLTIDGPGAVSSGTVSFTQVSSIQGDNTDSVSGDASWVLSGSGAKSSLADILFSGQWRVTTSSGSLTGSDGADAFVLESNGTVSANGLNFAGLSNVVGGAGGDDLDASAYAGGISLAGADSRLSAAGIQFQDILSVTTDVLNALATGSEFEVLGANSVSTSGMIFNGVKNVAGGAGVDRVSGADNWTVNVDGGGNYLTATKSADLVFRNIDSFDTDNGSLTDTVGGGTILLNADSSIDVHNMSFTGLANLTADGSGDLDASGFIDGLALTGSDGEVAANALSIRGIATAKVSGLAGSAADDYFAIATNGDITARSMVFSGVSEVSAGSAGNAVGGADGFDWQIIDTDSAGNNGIAFHGFSDLTAVNAGLIGTAGDDLFTLSGSESAGASVAYEQMVFTGVSAVDGNGSAAAGDHLDAGAYSDSLSLTGVDKQLAAGGLTFSNFDSAELSVLYGSASDENFVVTGTDAIAIANLNISGLSEVYGEGGVNTLTALGKATLNKNGFARNGDIKFYSINEIIADSLDATDGDDLLAFDVDGNVTVNGYKISASTYVDAKGGNDTVTGVDGIDWTIQGASSAENNGVTFDNVEILEVVNAGLYGTANADVFNLDSAGLITIGNLSVSGMSFVDGNGGVDALNAVDLAGGLALTATAGALKAGDLDVFGMDSATAKILTGTGADEQFQLTGSGQLTDGNISFSGVQQLIGNGGSDSLSSTVNENWVLASGAVSVDHGNVNFSGISSFSGGSGVVQGHASGHSFIIEGDNKLAIDALRFSDIASVEAATGTDDVTTVAAVALGSMDNTFSSSNMNFSGVDSVTTSALVGSDSAAQYTLTGSGQLTVNDIEFDGLATVSAGSADSDRVLSRSGQNYALNADSTVAHDGIVFSGVEAFEGLGDNDLDASAFVAGLMLNGNHNEVVADGVTFAGLAEVTTGKLAGSAGSYGFTVSSSDLDVLSMLFMGVTDVTAGAGNSVTGADAVDWQIVDIDSAENSGIAFHGFNDLTASNAGLIGTSGDDTFVLSGSESAGALVAYQQMTFGGVSYVAGGGSISAGDHLDASGYTDALALNGSDNALLAGSLLFSGFDSAQLAQLIGHAGDDTFSVTGDGAVTVAGLDISGLTEVRGGGGSNTLMTEGTASLSEAGYTSSGAIDFYDIQTIIAGLLEATDGDDRLAFADNGNITVNGYEIGSSTYVDAKGGSDTVTGASAQNWIITGESSAENNGVTFANVEYLNAVGGGLYGTGAADSFTLGNDGSVTIGNLSIAGMSFIDGAGASDSLDASEYAAGIALASNFGELAAGSLSIIGIENVATAALRGSAVADEFSITGSGQLSASGVNFSGIAQLDGGGGQDLLTSELDSAWAMAAAATGVRHGDVSIAGIESLSGANGQLVGHADGHDFTVDGSQLVSVGDMQFADIVEVVAAEGADAVSAASAVTLGGVSGVFTTSDIAFSGIDSAVASDLIGSSAAEQFTLDGSGALSVNGIAFSGLSSVKAGDGDDDEVISRSGQDYELQADNSVQHESIAFSGVESFSGNAAQLVANGQASARITGSRSVATGAATFSGLDSLSLVGGATELVAWNGVTINGSGSVTSGGIQVTGVSGVSATGALIGTADDDMFAVSANNTLSSAGMTFRDVDVVAAGGGTDRVQGFAGDGWQLEGGDGALRHGAINFSGLEHASGGSGVVDAGDGDRQFSVTSGGQLLTSAIRFDGIHTVNAGSGNDNVATMSGQQWTLGEDAGSAATEGMVFHNIERVSTAAARVDASANSGAESFALAANSTELTVLGLIFGDVAEVIAGVAGGDQLTSAASDWQLGGGENRLSVNGVAFAGIDRVATADAQLTATAAAEQFALAGADNALHVAGIEFEGVQSVIGNGGDDALIGSDGDDVFALADDGDISAAGMLFSGIASVDSGSGVDSVSGDGAAWRSTVAQAGNQLMNGAAVAQVDSITVQFQNLERVTNTGTYSGPEFSADYHLVGANSLAIGGIIYGGLDSIAAGSAADTLYGVDADLSWVLGDGQGSLTDGASTLVFSGFESIIGGAGADQFDLNGGVLDSLNTGAGNDTVNLAGMQLDTLHLGAGDDLVAVLSDSQPATLTGGAGSDLLQMQLTGQQWQFNGDSSTQNQVGNFLFSQFENLQDSGGGLNLVTSQQFNFTANGDAAGVVFSADGMQLAYDPAGDLVLLSSAKAPVGGSLKARNADLTLAGDLDIETDVASLSLRTSGGDIDVAILAREHLQVGQIDVGRGNVSLASASANVGTTGVFGVLTAESFDDTHIKAGNIQLGTPELSWGAIGSEDIPLRLDATQSVGIVALEYYDPFFDGQQPLAFSATGDKRQSIAGAQTAQGLKSAVQNPVDDIAQLDPGIFSEVTPYSLGVDPLNLPEVRLHAGELVPLGERDEKRRRDMRSAVGGH